MLVFTSFGFRAPIVKEKLRDVIFPENKTILIIPFAGYNPISCALNEKNGLIDFGFKEENIYICSDRSSFERAYWDDSFSLVMSYPHSNIIYHKFYDYDGNYLESKTNNQFVYLVWRKLNYAFINHQVFWELLSKDNFSVQQRNTLDEIEQLMFDSTSITYETLDQIILLLEEIELSDKYAVQGYKKLKNILALHNIKDELEKPLLNIMVLNQSGEFGHRTHKWISLMNARRIERIAKISGEKFKNIICDIDLLWKNMKAVSAE